MSTKAKIGITFVVAFLLLIVLAITIPSSVERTALVNGTDSKSEADADSSYVASPPCASADTAGVHWIMEEHPELKPEQAARIICHPTGGIIEFEMNVLYDAQLANGLTQPVEEKQRLIAQWRESGLSDYEILAKLGDYESLYKTRLQAYEAQMRKFHVDPTVLANIRESAGTGEFAAIPYDAISSCSYSTQGHGDVEQLLRLYSQMAAEFQVLQRGFMFEDSRNRKIRDAQDTAQELHKFIVSKHIQDLNVASYCTESGEPISMMTPAN